MVTVPSSGRMAVLAFDSKIGFYLSRVAHAPFTPFGNSQTRSKSAEIIGLLNKIGKDIATALGDAVFGDAGFPGCHYQLLLFACASIATLRRRSISSTTCFGI
jgi:hypothetical protein